MKIYNCRGLVKLFCYQYLGNKEEATWKNISTLARKTRVKEGEPVHCVEVH